MYHELGRRLLGARGFWMRPQLNSGTLGRRRIYPSGMTLSVSFSRCIGMTDHLRRARCRRLPHAWLLLLTSLLCSRCGGRSESDSRSSCRTPEQFIDSGGEIVECRVVQVVACEGRDGGTVLCPGTDASQCGTPFIDAHARCTPACSAIAYTLECPESPPPFGRPPGSPAGCVTLWSDSPSLACCPCLDD
jgi:hypothetical protein